MAGFVGTAGEGISVDGRPLGGGQFGLDAVIVECDGIIAGSGSFGFMAEAAAVALFRMISRAGIEVQGPGGGHQQDVPEVGMSRSAEMGVGKTYDGRIVITVTCAEGINLRLVFPCDIVGNRVRVGTHLHASERHAGTREGVSHA